MPDTATQTQPEGPVALAASLAETLEQEHEALVALAALFERHRSALQERRRDLLRLSDEAAPIEAAAEALRAHPGGREAAQRLRTLRDDVRNQAAETQQQCRDLEFSLQYAIDLGRDLIHAVQGLDTAAHSTRTYTPGGATREAPPSRSFLNKLG